MKTKLHYVLLLAIIFVTSSASSQDNLWKKTNKTKDSKVFEKLNIDLKKAHVFEMNIEAFKNKLSKAPLREKHSEKNATVVNIPGNNGQIETFKIYEAPVFAPSLSAKYPEIKSYIGFSTNNSGARLRMSMSPRGLQTMITYPDKPTVFMQPIVKGKLDYVLYSKMSKTTKNTAFRCSTLDALDNTLNKASKTNKIDEGGANDQILRKFRIAISTTAEYTTYHGGTVAGALAGINATLTRVNGIFETDMAVTFELVDATQIIYTDASTDPYSNATTGAAEANADNINGWSIQLQNTLSNELDSTLALSNAAYDIGHLFGASGGGGNAGCIGCVCNDDTASTTDKNKGSGFTSPANDIPEGDTFDINYVIHEIGHQMGANHTWAFTTEGSNVNSEPGSGSTIMGYAGITGSDDVQSDSDDYFHYHSIKQILDNLQTQTCWTLNTTPAITNSPPVADAGSDYKIPAGTPYVLKGFASDANSSDNLTYCWEQTDSGLVDFSNFGPDLSTGSMNRSLLPSIKSDRYIPRLTSVLNGHVTQTNPGLGSDWETASNVSRILNWALTVRDRNTFSSNGGQTSFDTMQIEVLAGTGANPVGPFKVTSQNTSALNFDVESTQLVTWDVANTNLSPINTTMVNIRLSIDGGLTYPELLVTTANDGSENITFPAGVAAPFCRIMVEPVDNIYYAVNTEDFSLGYNITTTCDQQYNSSPNPLNLNINDGQTITDLINVPTTGTISDLKINVNVEHSFISDLKVTLTHPDNITSAILWNENCFVGSGYQDFNITFEDGAGAVNCASPTNGTYIPAEALSIFDGMESSGDWKISISDGAPVDQGQLINWDLDFCISEVSFSTRAFNTFENFTMYPNPNEGTFTIKLHSAQNTPITVSVFDLRGRQIYYSVFENSGNLNEQITLHDVQSGMYILDISDGLRHANKKIIVK